MLLRKKPESSGFTLIEIAIVISIMGILSIPLIRLYINYYTQQKSEATSENILETQAQISRYFNFRDAYPLPARRDLPSSHADYGRSISASVAAALAPGLCIGNGGVCKVQGVRDTEADVDASEDFVLIGAVPVRTIRDDTGARFPDTIGLDGWNSKLTYAVTLNLTSSATYSNEYGVIQAIDENFNDTAGIVNDGHYAIISHGPNKRGAFSNDGGLTEPCGSISIDATDPSNVIIITDALENHNCNLDGRFMQGLQAYRGNSGMYNDDYVIFSKTQTLSIWENSLDQLTVFNKNDGNVGVNTPTPTQKLDVDGTLTARTTVSDGVGPNLGVLATEICSSDGTDCFPISNITSTTGMTCPSGQIITKISGPNGTLSCAVPTFSALNPFDCGTGVIQGIRTNGDVICFEP